MSLLRNPIALGAVAVLIVGSLVALILLLIVPHLFGGIGYTELTADEPVLSVPEGLTAAAEPKTLEIGLAVKITAIPNGAFLNRQAGREWAVAAQSFPSYLILTGPVFGIQTNAREAGAALLNLTLNIPSNSQPYETLDVYAWDGARWSFLPSEIQGNTVVAQLDASRAKTWAVAVVQTKPAIPITATLLEPGQTFSAEAAAALNIVAPAALNVRPDGTLIGALAGGYQIEQGYAVTPVVRNHSGAGSPPDTTALNAILADPTLQAAHVQSLVDFAVGDHYDGLVLDYRGLDPTQSAAFSAFVQNLAAGLHAQKKTLAVLLPPPIFDGADSRPDTDGYDWQALGLAADSLLIPLGGDPASLGNGEADRLLAWAARNVNRYKIQLLVSSRSTDGANGALNLIDYPTALGKFGTATLSSDPSPIMPGHTVTVALSGKVQTLDYDNAAAAPRFTYLDEAGATHTVWLTTADALTLRFALVPKYHLGGVAVTELLADGNAPGVLNAVARFRANQAAAGATPLTLVWTVNSSAGPIAQATAAPNAPFLWPAGEPGPYEIAAVLQGSSQTGLGVVALTVPAMTETPTAPAAGPTNPPRPALPTATPCVGCPTNTPAPPTATSPPAAPPAINPGASGPFELGGQVVHGGLTYAADMKRAGMTWVKLQGYYGGDYAAAISNAHAQGFKILLSVVDGAHAGAPVTSASYQEAFGNYLAGLASQGADALEVWNEPNIDREWPTGQVSGASYTQLLKTVYPKIKAANGNTLVISAAPAPTGYFGAAGCTAQGCNDDVFLQAVTAAGGANYLDCVGIHFNTGTTSPSATSGSALSGYHYSYYFWPMINTYRAAFQNARQLCFTELGYLTDDGYSPPVEQTAPSFSWAANVSVAQQAAWLAESAQLSRDSGVVRMMIVFNVDFTVWGADPQGGYAIIRPDGTCPACNSLDAVMP